MGKKPTIDDVARVAGVARATVSRVLNASPNTSEQVRERVMQAVADLGYQVNHQARQLASGASRQLALVFAAAGDAEPNSYYHSAVELGAMRASSALGYGLVTHTFDPGIGEDRRRILNLTDGQRYDGLVLTPPFSDDAELIAALLQRGFPFILISAGPNARSLSDSVGIDDRQAGLELGQLIVGEGHRRIAFISGPPDHESAALRLEGFLEAVREAGLPPDSVTIVQGNFTFRSGIEGADALLAAGRRPTALVCANDDMAAGALFSAHRLGLKIPSDLSITGFDDTPVSQIVWPPLTTVHQPLRQMGAKAVELLTDGIMRDNGQSDAPRSPHMVPFHLVHRDSTCVPAGD